MGMSTHVQGIRPADDRWRAMKSVWDSCKAAGVTPPAEVDLFFEGEDPDPAGVVIDLDRHASTREWSDEYRSGYEVVLSELPPEVTVIRFYNSW